MSREVERDFRAAICSEGSRGAAAIYGNLEEAGRTEDGDGLPGRSQSKCLSELPDFLAANRELDGARCDCHGGNIFGREVRHKIAERIHTQYDALNCLACWFCFWHSESPAVSDFFAKCFGLKGL